jgi:hypothetical protein
MPSYSEVILTLRSRFRGHICGLVEGGSEPPSKSQTRIPESGRQTLVAPLDLTQVTES